MILVLTEDDGTLLDTMEDVEDGDRYTVSLPGFIYPSYK